MRYAALTEKGKVRPNNEDACYADGRVFIVADGMGGHRGGETASSLAVQVFLEKERELGNLPPVERIRRAMKAANRAVWRKGGEEPALQGMGTTFTVLLLEGHGYIGHVGDSRAYLFRDGNLQRMTEDHSLVEEMVREGRLDPAMAREHPQRNVILRALGVSREVEVDAVSFTPFQGDRVLLCSDGLTGALEDREIRDFLEVERDTERCCRMLVGEAERRGGEDNITVVLVDIQTGGRIGEGKGRGGRTGLKGLFRFRRPGGRRKENGW